MVIEPDYLLAVTEGMTYMEKMGSAFLGVAVLIGACDIIQAIHRMYHHRPSLDDTDDDRERKRGE